MALALAFIEESFQGGWACFEGTAEAADKFGRERLEYEAVGFLEEGHLRAFADGVLAAEFRGNDELAFGGYRRDLGFHCSCRFVSLTIKQYTIT